MSFLNFLVFLPKLINSLVELHRIFKDAAVEKWMDELDVAIKESREAKNAEDRRFAAIKLANVMRKL